MPTPLSALSPDEQHLYASAPGDAVAPLGLADAAEEQGQQHRADLLRGDTHLALLERLRGQSLTNEESAQVAQRIAALQEKTPADVERVLSAALGAPHSDAMLALLAPDGQLDAQRLRQQFDFQLALLASLDLLEVQNNQLGITAIDDRFHPVPSLAALQERLAAPEMRAKIAQGFNQLLLVPFGLPLVRLLDAWRQGLRRNEHLLEAHGGLDRQQPLWVWEEGYGLQDGKGPDADGRLVYVPQRFAADHDGQTKAQLLAAGPAAGWQVLLTEGGLTELPRAGQGRTVGGRPQIEAGQTPRRYLAGFPPNETGLTPEAYVTAFLTALERSGRPLDAQTHSYLTGACLPASGCAPCACWGPGNRRALLDGNHPGNAFADSGARAAARVV